MQPMLEGRVFARQQRFAGLPADIQDDTKQFQAHVQYNKQKLFQTNHSALVKSVYSVKGKDLVDAVVEWLQTHGSQRTQRTGFAGTGAGAGTGTGVAAVAPASTTTTHVSDEVYERARQISEALVLSGFLTPYKDNEKHLNAPEPEYFGGENELLIPIAQGVTEHTTTSVWSVAHGAIYAGFLKRKAGMLAQFTHGKDVYVVVNGLSRALSLFESDLARVPIAEFAGDNLSVQYDNTHFEFGVHVAPRVAGENDEPELFNAGSAHAQNEFMNALVNIGAGYRERSFTPASTSTAPIGAAHEHEATHEHNAAHAPFGGAHEHGASNEHGHGPAHMLGAAHMPGTTRDHGTANQQSGCPCGHGPTHEHNAAHAPFGGAHEHGASNEHGHGHGPFGATHGHGAAHDHGGARELGTAQDPDGATAPKSSTMEFMVIQAAPAAM